MKDVVENGLDWWDQRRCVTIMECNSKNVDSEVRSRLFRRATTANAGSTQMINDTYVNEVT